MCFERTVADRGRILQLVFQTHAEVSSLLAIIAVCLSYRFLLTRCLFLALPPNSPYSCIFMRVCCTNLPFSFGH